MTPEPGLRTAEGIANVARYHTPSSEVGRIAREARVKCLMLNHFVPTRFEKAAVLAEVQRDYTGPILIGEDLMSLDIDTRTVIHAGARIALGTGAMRSE